MRNYICIYLILVTSLGCQKHIQKQIVSAANCNIDQVYLDNSKKITITTGLWGTLSYREGGCVPSFPGSIDILKNCPVQRTIKIYQYTLLTDAISSKPYTGFFDKFNTAVVAETTTDAEGFYQINIPPGHYTIVVVEHGMLYDMGISDLQQGLNPVVLSHGLTNVNLTMTYNTTF